MFFEKQSGEVADNKGKGYMNSQKQTGKQSGEVVENTWLWKKQTGTKLKTNRAMLLKIHDGSKTNRKRTGANPEICRGAASQFSPRIGSFRHEFGAVSP